MPMLSTSLTIGSLFLGYASALRVHEYNGVGSVASKLFPCNLTNVGGVHKFYPEIAARHWEEQTYGMYTLCEDILPQHPVVVSIGILDDVSFERDMVERFGAEVFGYDPTPSSVEYVSSLLENASHKPSSNDAQWTQRFHFEPVGVYGKDGEIGMQVPVLVQQPKSGRLHPGVAFTRVPANTTKVNVKVKTLKHLMQRAGAQVDVLKMDVEGAEYEALPEVLQDCSASFSQLLIEFHDPGQKIPLFHSALEKCGYTGHPTGKLGHIEMLYVSSKKLPVSA